MLNRRIAIQQLVLIWAGVASLPACLHTDDSVSVPLKHIHVKGGDERMLAELTETILPKTDTPGAKDIAAHLFAMKMVDDCFTRVNQDKYIHGMKTFEESVQKKTGKSFLECSPAERQAIVAELDSRPAQDDGDIFFFQATKKLTVQAYTTCEYYLTNIRGYKMIPGKFQGCIPVSKA